MTLPHAMRLPSLPAVTGGLLVHIVLLVVYGLTAWLALLAWASIAGPVGSVWAILALSPLVVSGVIVALVLSDLAYCGLRWCWCRRSALLWWRAL